MKVDYLNITVPTNDNTQSIKDSVIKAMSMCACIQVSDVLWRLGEGGTVKIEDNRTKPFTLFSASGSALESLRINGQYVDYVMSFANNPHKVSKMDIAHDVSLPTPPLIKALYKRANDPDKGVSLTRKKVQPKHIRQILSKGINGVDTGTLYLGRRSAEVKLTLYDKQHEHWQRTGMDIGETSRYELSVTSKMGISLKDVMSPDALFWRFASDVLPPPANAPEWVAGGLEYDLPAGVSLLPAESLKRRVELSGECGDLGSWFKCADELGPHGLDYLLSRVRNSHEQWVERKTRKADQQQKLNVAS